MNELGFSFIKLKNSRFVLSLIIISISITRLINVNKRENISVHLLLEYN